MIQTDRTEEKRIHPDFLGFFIKMMAFWRSLLPFAVLCSCRSESQWTRTQESNGPTRRLEAEFVHMHLVQRAVEDVLCVFGNVIL